MKYLLLVAIVVFVLWLMKSKSRPQAPGPDGTAARKRKAPPGGPVAMLACVHCGVHLPQSDAVLDAGGRPYCSEAHRLAGPR